MMTLLNPRRSKYWLAPGRVGSERGVRCRPGALLGAWLWGAFFAAQSWAAPAALATLVTANQPRTVSIICDFAPPQLQVVDDHTQVTVAGCDHLERVGEPSLPFRTVRLLLPPGANLVGIEAQTELASVMLTCESPVEHGRIPRRYPGANETGPAVLPPDEPDPTIYSSDAPFPAATVELASVQRLGGYDIAFVRVYPVQYSPLSGILAFAPRLRVAVSLSSATKLTAPPTRLPGSNRARQDVAAMVDNPDGLAAYGSAALLSAPSPAIYDYLLLTKSNLVAAFQPLVNQKVAAGLTVKVEAIENITVSQAGRDLAEKVRSYIRFAYTNWGVTYVLLGGDTSTVPTRYAYAYMSTLEAGRFPRHLPACDLYYACLDGSWDRNGNGTFGEPTDGESGGEVDLLAEVYVGRAPVDTVAEANTFVEKTVRYETQMHGRLTNALFIAEYLGTAGGTVAQGWDMFVPLTNYFAQFQLARLDDVPYTTPQWSYLDALNELNRSPHVALFAGHGDPSTMMGLIPDDLDTLTNPWPSLTYSVSCDAGAFDNDNFFDPFDCIGEELVRRNPHAAFAAILNSREGWYDAANEWKWSGEFQIKFFDELLHKSHTRLGVANQLSKHDMISKVETSGLMTYRFCYFEINLFGDPHVALLTRTASLQLLINSARGGCSLPLGTNDYAPGTVVTCGVTNSPLLGEAGMRYVCTGWSGTGDAPVSGSSTQVSFTLSTNSQLVWSWKTQVWFAASITGGGFVSATEGWQDIASTLPVQAIASNYYHFVRWTGDVPAGMESNANLTLNMSQPRTVAATFAANLTSRGTPEAWLASYGWTNQFEAASLADSDHDGMAAWAEYIAGTSPVDSASVLRANLVAGGAPGAGRALQWPSVANRWYSVYRADSPTGVFTRLTNGIPATPPMNAFTDSTVGSAGFYRVGATNSP